MKKLLLLGMLLLPSIADAADNTVLITPCASGCITMKSRDVGAGVESLQTIPGDLTGGAIGNLAAYGTAPTGNALPVNAFVTNTLASVGDNADGVATSATAGSPVVNYNFGWNGTTWDRVKATSGKLLVTPDSVALPANQSVNVSQVNGVTPLMNNGASGTGSPRMNVANDNTAIANWGQGATAAAVPSGALYQAANVGGNLTGSIKCGSSIPYDASTSGSTQLVALASSQKVYICGYSIFGAGTVNVKLVYGTGSNCATGQQPITPAYQLTAQTGVVDGSPEYRGLGTIASNALCINASAAVAVQAIVYYTQF